MGSNVCMNLYCGTTTSSEWKNGWVRPSGGFATLCSTCGSLFEGSVYCETFHQELPVWLECNICAKRIHLGCIASKHLHAYMDMGGVGCVSCVERFGHDYRKPLEVQIQIHGEEASNGISGSNGNGNLQTFADNELSKVIDSKEFVDPFQSINNDTGLSLGQLNQEQPQHPIGESSLFKKPDMYESMTSAQPIGGESEGVDPSKGQRLQHISVKAAEANKGSPSQSHSQPRVARPPVEGRGRNQLLPRYWPRITDEEIQKISGELNINIVPLFEKVLSASDAGRIGRLVLPKACAEAYFPQINQSEGLPIRVKDVKGKEWTFQFRFWPNNNSRMYVLEGVTPCIQNMQLEAGDTVIFSRTDPGGKLVIGFRKATNNDTQDPQTSDVYNGSLSKETNEHLGANGGGNTNDEHVEKKRSRNIGSKNKRLLMHSEDAAMLRVSCAEAQDLMRPPPNSVPNVILIEGHEFEEYDQPPVLGKKTIFTARPSGEHDQWTECDSCSKWRRLPMDVLVPAKWSCVDNIWNPNRSSCSVPEDINEKDLEALLPINKGIKKRRVGENNVSEEFEPSGLDALATAAVLGDQNMGDLGDNSIGATTRHPRHRPGCSCIVCIQPPSGKGKHPSSCKCAVCSTVRRRFKTLMMRKKKRQSDREAELAQERDQDVKKNDMEAGEALLQIIQSENDAIQSLNQMEEVAEGSKGILDLNFHPNREDELLAVAARMTMTSLVNATDLPLTLYLEKDNHGSERTEKDVEIVNKRDLEMENKGDTEMENKGEDE